MNHTIIFLYYLYIFFLSHLPRNGLVVPAGQLRSSVSRCACQAQQSQCCKQLKQPKHLVRQGRHLSAFEDLPTTQNCVFWGSCVTGLRHCLYAVPGSEESGYIFKWKLYEIGGGITQLHVGFVDWRSVGFRRGQFARQVTLSIARSFECLCSKYSSKAEPKHRA